MTAGDVELRFLGFEQRDEIVLRARFEVVDADGLRFPALADLTSDGRVVDLQANDCHEIGTTGRSEVDDLIRRHVHAELIRARSAAVVWTFDRRQRPGRQHRRRAA